MNQLNRIPFNKPYVSPNALKYVEEALASDHQQGGGPFNRKAAELVRKINGGGEVFLTSSCTQALEMATILLDLKPGDEVIMPSYTFTSAATALVNYGVIPVFVDIDPIHLNIDPNRVREAITPKTKAISIVNYAGYACDYDALDSIVREFGLLKIEDNAHGFGTKSRSFKLGTWGDVSTLSFHATKNIQCGEGGALIVNNPTYVERAYVLQEKGTDRKSFIDGIVQKYQWQDKGGSFLLPEALSALLISQLDEFKYIQEGRLHIQKTYCEMLIEEGALNSISVLNGDELENQSSHLFGLQLLTKNASELQRYLKFHLIDANFHYQSLANSPFGRIYAKKSSNFINSENASKNFIRLPLWFGLTSNQIEKVTHHLVKFLFGSSKI